MEAEVREILTRAARRPHIGLALMLAAQEAGGVELDIPERSDLARTVDFG
jgi:plasmid stability protein